MHKIVHLFNVYVSWVNSVVKQEGFDPINNFETIKSTYTMDLSLSRRSKDVHRNKISCRLCGQELRSPGLSGKVMCKCLIRTEGAKSVMKIYPRLSLK